MNVTPESLAAFFQTEEFQFFLAAILYDSQPMRATLENAQFADIGVVANAQGKVQSVNRIVGEEFPGLLIDLCKDQTEADGGRMLMFSLRVHQFVERRRQGKV